MMAEVMKLKNKPGRSDITAEDVGCGDDHLVDQERCQDTNKVGCGWASERASECERECACARASVRV